MDEGDIVVLAHDERYLLSLHNHSSFAKPQAIYSRSRMMRFFYDMIPSTRWDFNDHFSEFFSEFLYFVPRNNNLWSRGYKSNNLIATILYKNNFDRRKNLIRTVFIT